MLTAFVAAVAMQTALGPVVPAGANRSFQEAVLVVEDALEKGDFAGADRAMAALPKHKFRVAWDDSGAPASYRSAYAEARDVALREWSTLVTGYGFELVKDKPDLRFSFASDLTDNADGIPSGAAHVFSTAAGDPRLSTTIGTQRGRPAQPASPTDVRNEIHYGIAAYLGMERTNFPGAASFRSDLPGIGAVKVGQGEQLSASRLFAVVDKLREAITKKIKLVAARPRLQVEPLRVELAKANQGDSVSFSIQVSNPGNAPLSFRFIPDCGCIAPNYTPLLDAGRSSIVTVNVDTVNFVGELRHKFYVYANDPDIPYRELPVSIDVDPLYRFVKPGPSVAQMSDSGADVEVYLLLNERMKLAVRDFKLEGNAGTVKPEPWSGSISMPGGGKVKGSGYKVKVHLVRSPVPGRITAALVVSTDNIVVPLIRTNLFAQRGILALPEAVYFGEMAKAPNVASVLLSRPDLPFKVTKVESDSPFFKASVKPQIGGFEYRLVVEFDGKADYGPVSATITVHTDDPKQPKLMVPVIGSIR